MASVTSSVIKLAQSSWFFIIFHVFSFYHRTSTPLYTSPSSTANLKSSKYYWDTALTSSTEAEGWGVSPVLFFSFIYDGVKYNVRKLGIRRTVFWLKWDVFQFLHRDL